MKMNFFLHPMFPPAPSFNPSSLCELLHAFGERTKRSKPRRTRRTRKMFLFCGVESHNRAECQVVIAIRLYRQRTLEHPDFFNGKSRWRQSLSWGDFQEAPFGVFNFFSIQVPCLWRTVPPLPRMPAKRRHSRPRADFR